MARRFAIAVGAAALVVFSVPAAAQQHQPDMHKGMHGMTPGMEMMMKSPWREMDEFHALLHRSHQAMMKSGDLGPARQDAALLADAAETWSKTPPPADCKAPDGIGETVTVLATDARAYATLVAANGSDGEVKAALGKLHDEFMPAHMGCMPMDKEMPMKHEAPPK